MSTIPKFTGTLVKLKDIIQYKNGLVVVCDRIGEAYIINENGEHTLIEVIEHNYSNNEYKVIIKMNKLLYEVTGSDIDNIMFIF
jgi:hypothetical protein